MKTIALALLLSASACTPSKAEFNDQVDELQIDMDAKVIGNAVAQYEMVKRHGNKTDMCLRAGLVAELFLQATYKLEVEYVKWKAIEKRDCAAM